MGGANTMCFMFFNCMCTSVDPCDSCTLSDPDACTASGCNPKIIGTASCTTGHCNAPHVECAYLKRDSSGSGQGSCIVGSTAGWEGQTCSSWTDESPCGCSLACSSITTCDLNNCAPPTAASTGACPTGVDLLGESASCHIRLPCAGGTAVTSTGGACWNSASQYSGIYSTSDSSCVLCAGWTKAGTILADAGGIKVDCQGNAETISPSRCEVACGAPDNGCDDHLVGEGCDPEDPEKKCTILCECDGDDGDTCDPDENYADGSNDICIAANPSERYCCSPDNVCGECCDDTDCIGAEEVCASDSEKYEKCDAPPRAPTPGPAYTYKCSICDPCTDNDDCISNACCDDAPYSPHGPGDCWIAGVPPSYLNWLCY